MTTPSPAAATATAPRARAASKRLPGTHWAGFLHAAIGVAILLLVWELVALLFHPLPVFLPSPFAVARRLSVMLTSSERWADIGISIARVLGGFVLGTLFGISAALWLALNPFVDRSLRYPLVALRFIVPFAWVPIAAYWFALSETGKVFITFYASFFVVLFQVRAGVERIPPVYLKVSRTLGLSAARTLWQVILPAALPSIVVGMRLGLSFAWVAILAAEMVNANTGIGYFVNYSGQFLATDDVLAGMVVIGVIGFAMDRALGWLGRALQPDSFIIH